MIEITAAHLKVFSAVCSNFVVVWLAAVLAATNSVMLTVNLILGILAWYLAVSAEHLLERYYES